MTITTKSDQRQTTREREREARRLQWLIAAIRQTPLRQPAA